MLPSLSASFDGGGVVARGSDVFGPRTELGGDLLLEWDPDLFGRRAHASDAARARLRAAGYDLASVRRSVVAEVARNYVLFRGLNARVANAREAVETQERILDIIRGRHENGISPAVDLEQAKLQLLQVEALIPQLEDARNRAENRVAVLTDRVPGALHGSLGESGAIPMSALAPPLGVPADLLRRRPDILAAEQRVLSAISGSRSARAGLFPQASLAGVVSARSFSLATLADTLTSSLFGSLTQALFDGGRRKAELRESRAVTREAVSAYRGQLLSALEEVTGALSAMQAGAERVRIGAEARDAAVRNAEQSRGQYDIGLIDLFILLDAEQQLLSQRDDLIIAQADYASSIISAYNALGGGWQIE
jgi:NodT family efflux transporter outer membrane factor (OMF) lipoprotein